MTTGCQCAHDAACRNPAPAGEACQDHQADALMAKLATSSSLTAKTIAWLIEPQRELEA
jgi:hypothetical protein